MGFRVLISLFVSGDLPGIFDLCIFGSHDGLGVIVRFAQLIDQGWGVNVEGQI